MRIWSAVARAMLSLALSLTSCTRGPSSFRWLSPAGCRLLVSWSVPRVLPLAGRVFFVGASLGSTEVDAQRFGCAEGVLVELAGLGFLTPPVHDFGGWGARAALL